MKVILNNTSMVFRQYNPTSIPLSHITIDTLNDLLIGNGAQPEVYPLNTLTYQDVGAKLLLLDVHNYVGKKINVSTDVAVGGAVYFFAFADSNSEGTEAGDVITPVGNPISGNASTQSVSDVVIPSGAYYCYIGYKGTVTGNIDNT